MLTTNGKINGEIDPEFEHILYAVMLEDDFYEFVKEAWQYVVQDEYVDISIIKILCQHYQAVYEGKISRLAISIPPGFCKSLIGCVFFPAWVWTKNPTVRFVTGSYSLSFATRDAQRTRELIRSNWYQRLWGHKVQMVGDQDVKTNYRNTAKGFRFVFGTGSAYTGERADYIIVDDGLKFQDAYSKLAREKVNQLIGNLHTRLVNPKAGAIIIIGQRLHIDDPIGHVLKNKKKKFEYLCLPLVCDPARRCKTIIFKDKRKAGESLWPERFDDEEIASKKEDMGSRDFNAQYQQNPESESGSILKREWFRYYRELPKFKYILQSTDTAFTKKKTSDYSAVTTWGVTDNGYYLIDLWFEKLEFPELKRKVNSLYNKYRPHKSIVERPAVGQALISEFERDTRIPIEGITPEGSKEQRVYVISPLFEAGKVYFPEDAAWLSDFEDELVQFPAVLHDDRTDSVSMALIYLSQQYRTPSLRSL